MTMDAGAKNSGHGLLQAVESILSTVFIPSLKKLDKGWGDLDKEPTNQTKTDFLNNLDSFVAVLTGALMSFQVQYYYYLFLSKHYCCSSLHQLWLTSACIVYSPYW